MGKNRAIRALIAKPTASAFQPKGTSGRLPSRFYIPATFGKIDHLFATQESAYSDRPVQTITPLAATLNLKIKHDFKDDDFKGISGPYPG